MKTAALEFGNPLIERFLFRFFAYSGCYWLRWANGAIISDKALSAFLFLLAFLFLYTSKGKYLKWCIFWAVLLGSSELGDDLIVLQIAIFVGTIILMGLEAAQGLSANVAGSNTEV